MAEIAVPVRRLTRNGRPLPADDDSTADWDLRRRSLGKDVPARLSTELCNRRRKDEPTVLNARYRRAVRARGHFPTEQVALKCVYLVTRNAFAITFADRWPAEEIYNENRQKRRLRDRPEAMVALNVKRLVAFDLHGLTGSPVRHWVVVCEFALGSMVALSLGPLLVVRGNVGGWVFGILVLGVGLNLLPMAIYSFLLSPPTRVRRELEGVDLHKELRIYLRALGWLLVPGAVAGLACVQAFGRQK